MRSDRVSFRKVWQGQRLFDLPFLFPPRPKYPILLPFAALVPEHLATPSVRPVHLSPELADPSPGHRPARATETGVHRIEPLPRPAAYGHAEPHSLHPPATRVTLHLAASH